MSFLALLIVHELCELARPRGGASAGEADCVKDGMIYGCAMLVAALLLSPSFAVLPASLILFAARTAILRAGGLFARGRGAALKGYAFHAAAHAGILYLASRLLPGAWIFEAVGEWLGVPIGVRALFIAFGYLTIARPTAVLVRQVLALLRLDGIEVAASGAGWLIGILERAIVFTLGLSGQYAAIGFMLAAKSVARLRKFEDADFAEQYIVGTLTSIGVAVLLSSIYGWLPA